MDLEAAMDEALDSGPDAVAIACADVRAGFVIGASARGDEAREAATSAAACAAEICALPAQDNAAGNAGDPVSEDDAEGAGALIVSTRWIHAYARVTRRPELVVVGVARGDANIALLLDWVKRVAGGLEAVA